MRAVRGRTVQMSVATRPSPREPRAALRPGGDPRRLSPAEAEGEPCLTRAHTHGIFFLFFSFFLSLFWLGGVALVATALRSRSRGAKGIGGRGWGEARGTPRSRASPGEVRPQDK